MFGNRVATLTQLGNDANLSSMVLFLSGPRYGIVGIDVNQYQPGNFASVQVGEGAHVVAAEGAANKNVGSAYAGMVKRSPKSELV